MSAVTSMVGSILDIFSGPDTAPAPAAPTVAPVTPMPTPDDEAAKAAKRRQAAALQKRKGRQSTILDQDQTDLLGG